jgi:hypothetical protein
MANDNIGGDVGDDELLSMRSVIATVPPVDLAAVTLATGHFRTMVRAARDGQQQRQRQHGDGSHTGVQAAVLGEVDLRYFPFIGDGALVLVAEHLQGHLRALHLGAGYPLRISCSAVLTLGRLCYNLRFLSLWGVTDVNDATLTHCLVHCWPRLRLLDLTDCSTLTDATVDCIRTLRARHSGGGCSGGDCSGGDCSVGDAEHRFRATHLQPHGLVALNLARCSGITLGAIETLLEASALPLLRQVSIGGCDGVSIDDLTKAGVVVKRVQQRWPKREITLNRIRIELEVSPGFDDGELAAGE